HSARPFPHLAPLAAFCAILDQTMPQHPYVIEPQSRQYRAHGDLWDHLVLESARPEGAGPVLLPLTLEMGSWLWIKKNPRQLFSRLGLFNPLIEHRQQRVLRRHLGLLDCIARMAGSHRRWQPQGEERARHRQQALTRWYGARPEGAA